MTNIYKENKKYYWKDAPHWAVAFGHTKDGLPVWIGEKGYAYCYKPKYVYEYGVTGQYREHLVEIMTREDDTENAKVNQFEYPIYKKSKFDSLVLRFTAPKQGEVIVKNEKYDVGYVASNWAVHTNTCMWENWTPPQLNSTKEDFIEGSEVEYPIYKRLRGEDLVVKFTGLEEGEVLVSNSHWVVGYVADDWICHTDTETWEDWTPPHETTKDLTALDTQQGGNHYKDFKIQPVEFIDANKLDYFQGNVVKYITRHKAKNGAEDIRKAIHYCQLILQMQYGEQ